MMKRAIVSTVLLILLLAAGASASTSKVDKKAELKAMRHDPAYHNGYDDGYRAGARDSEALSSTYNDEVGPVYQQATDGYTPKYGGEAKYQEIFRHGYIAGYKAGWDFNAGRYIPFGGSR